jgi:hypothetical protein
MPEKKLTEVKAIPFRGGQDKFIEPALLPVGGYSAVQNMRQMGLGMKKRMGIIKQHSTADGSNRVLTLFQYSKGKRTERHFYAQFSDDDVLEATTAPPGTTTGVFGTEVFSGTASSIPASWAVLNDKLLFSNGVDQHQVCAGTDDYIDKFLTYVSASALPAIPTIGSDFTDQVTDVSTTTYATLGALGTNATDAVVVCTQIQANRLYFGLTASVNSNSSLMTVYYWNGAWTSVSGLSDGTIASAGKSLGQSGYVTWTQPTDAITKYMYDQNGFWLKITFSAAMSATVNCHTVTFGSGFTALQDVWDGILQDAIECQFYDASAAAYYTMGSSSVTVGAMTSSDTLAFNFYDNIEMIYVDVGNTPNTVASITLTLKYLSTLNVWTSISIVYDGTSGLTRSGYLTFARTAVKPQQYGSLPYQAYWFQLTTSGTLSGTTLSDLSFGIQGVPYFDVSRFGVGLCNAAWKNRAVYTFDQDPAYLYISADGQPQVLSGMDSAIYKVGDGRANKVVAIKKFYNELIVAQEEKGNDGGCITIVQGTTPANLGKIILSNYYGAMNSQCLKVLDGIKFGEKDRQTIAFILSRRGLLYSDGRSVQHVPNYHKIKNYFDPSFTECIRTGYESHMYLGYDSSFNILTVGLVSSSSATVVNKWLVYDLGTLEFSEDSYGAPISCMAEAEAASGNVPIIQLGGGTADGFVYILNSGLNDVASSIDSYVTVELDGQGRFLHVAEIVLRMKVQTAGSCTITPYLNSVAQTAITKLMTAELANQTIRRHRFNVNCRGQHVSLKFAHNTASENFYLLDLALLVEEYLDQ